MKHYVVLAVALIGLCVWSNSALAADNGFSFRKLLMPGDVVEGHADIEHDCQSCHGSDGKEQKTLCLDCHEDVQSDFNNGEGLHGQISQSGVPECEGCHSEHLGREGDIVNLDTDSFDHGGTDFHLEGRHVGLSCIACHSSEKKYSEAPGECYACHEGDDSHRGSLGEACQDCHTPTDWRGEKFDHSETEFSLRGHHQEVRCNACHAGEKYVDTPSECNSCHAVNDIHEGVNGQECSSCHSEQKWDDVKFDHNVDTQFALKGSHEKLSCNDCHQQSASEKPLGDTCVDCHRKDDEHSGKNGDNCATCHSEDRWGLTDFSHGDTDFELRGKHSSVSCESCHRGGTSAEISSSCINCHRPDDAHAGQQGVECGACHNSSGWLDEVRFSHDLTAFPLVGIHAVTSCDACHASSEFSNTESRCVDCHREDDTHDGALGPQCHSCHNPNDWQLWVFDHNSQTSFELDGEHEGLACVECHFKATKTVVKQSTQCGTCHKNDDVHDRSFGRACDRCHETSSFENVRMQ